MDIGIYDITGKWVSNLIGKKMHSGKHNIVWKGDDMVGIDVSSCTYLVMMKFGFNSNKKDQYNQVIYILRVSPHISRVFCLWGDG